jgi:DedD protein
MPPAKPAEPAKSPASEQQSETYTIQVGVFSDKANVQKVQSRISGLGFKSYTEQVKNSTRVRVGAFSSRGEADAVAAKLAAGGVAGKVVEK